MAGYVASQRGGSDITTIIQLLGFTVCYPKVGLHILGSNTRQFCHKTPLASWILMYLVED